MRGRFTPEQRRQLMEAAWDMRQQTMSELNIAVELGVAQSTVHYWLEQMRRERSGQ